MHAKTTVRAVLTSVLVPFAFLELARNTRSNDYNVSLVVLDIRSGDRRRRSSACGIRMLGV